MFNIDKSIKRMLGSSSGKLTPDLKQKTSSLSELARSSIFFPFTQPTVKNPASGRVMQGRMPSMQRVMNNFGLKSFGGKNDWDGDGIKNKKDCQPRNVMRQDKIYSIRPYREKFAKEIIPTDLQFDYWKSKKGGLSQSKFPAMRGRDTGWFGSGIYGFATKQQAEDYLQTYGDRAGHQGYIREFEITKPFKPLTKHQSERLHSGSKELYKANTPSELSEAQYLLQIGGIHASIDELKRAKKYSKRIGEQPINYLLRQKGYTGVIPTEEFQTTSYGSVMHVAKPEKIPLDKTPFTEQELRRQRHYQKKRHEDALQKQEQEQKYFEEDLMKVADKPFPVVGEILEQKYIDGKWKTTKSRDYSLKEKKEAAKEYYGDKLVKFQSVKGTFDDMQNKWQNMSQEERDKERAKLPDKDGDRVPDKYDCNPNNVMEQDIWKKKGIEKPEDFKENRIENFEDWPGQMQGLLVRSQIPFQMSRRNIPPQQFGYPWDEIASENNFKQNAPLSLFHAGNQLPSETLKQKGKVYGFSNPQHAQGWKDKMGYKNLYQFSTYGANLDTRQYVRRGETPNAMNLSDNEWVAYEVENEKQL